ncbi:hypothetical protein Dip510_000892 [Elusimicrobium posterum]|uniref:ArnT family glycosyltransferase n=1 Tax=Elusimicrobium posterum TaxID=3116653 RepID=UPI003C735F89
MNPKKQKLLFFILAGLFLTVSLYFITSYNYLTGKMGTPFALQTSYEVSKEEFYAANSKDFEIKEKFLVARADAPVLRVMADGKTYNYITFFVRTLNVAEIADVYASSTLRTGETQEPKLVAEYMLIRDMNTIHIGRGNWTEVELRYFPGSNLFIDVDRVVLSERMPAPENSLLIFALSAVLVWALLAFILYGNLFGLMKKRPLLFLALIMLLQLGHIFYYADKKINFHVDEMASHLQASGDPESPLEYNKFLDTKRFNDALTVSRDDWGNFGTVYRKVSDSHPQLFHLQLHAVQFFFPETLSKWSGISINLFWFILSCPLLFFTARRFLKNDLYALGVVALWGFAPGITAMAIYARMYTIAAFFSILSLYLAYYIMDEEKPSRAVYLLLAVTAFTGILAHYYFIVWMFFLSCGAGLFLLFTKKYEKLKYYCYAVGAGTALNLAFLPTLENVLSSPRGLEAGANVFYLGDIFISLSDWFYNVDIGLFGKSATIIFIIAILFFIVARVAGQKKKKDMNKLYAEIFENGFLTKSIITVIACFFYFAFVAKVAPYNMFRYVHMAGPGFVMLMIGIIVMFAKLLFAVLLKADAAKKAVAATVCMALFFLISLNFAAHQMKVVELCNRFFADYRELTKYMFEGAQVIYLEPDVYAQRDIYGPIRNNFLHFTDYKEVYILPYNEYNMLPEQELAQVIAKLDKTKTAAFYATFQNADEFNNIFAKYGWTGRKFMDRGYIYLYKLEYTGGKK